MEIIIYFILVGLFCFVIGMVVELVINANEMNHMRNELDCTKQKLYGVENTPQVEVINIQDNDIVKDYFKPF